MTATCLYCNSSFSAKRASARFCTPAHRQAQHHAKPNVTNATPNAKLIPIEDDSEPRLALLEADNRALKAEVIELRRQLKVVSLVTSSLLSRWAYRAQASEEEVRKEFRDLGAVGQ